MRKLTNSLVAGLVAAFLLAEAVFLLNPELPHTWANVLSVFGTLAVTYGFAVAGSFWILLWIVELARGRPLGPAWLSYRVLTWLLALTLAGAAALLWKDLVDLRLYIPQATLRGLAVAATTVTAAAAMLLVVALFHYSFRRRGALVSYVVSSALLAAALALPLVMRPSPEAPRSVPRMPIEDTPADRRITVLGLEGASMAYVLPAVASGQLPNFARLIEGGASGSLRTLYPAESLAVWTSIATGKLPRQHGLKSFYRYRFPGVPVHVSLRPRGIDFSLLDRLGMLERSVVTSRLRQTQPFWSVLDGFGVDVALVRWWGTYPADEIDGWIVSEYFHRRRSEPSLRELPALTRPASLARALERDVVAAEAVENDLLARFVDQSVADDSGFDWETPLRRALADDATSDAIVHRLREEHRPQMVGVYYFGLDTVGHYFTRYHAPESFGDVSDEEIRKYGQTLDAYYRHLDEIVGRHLQARGDDETLILVSGHGMEPLGVAQRVLELLKGNRDLSGDHAASPDGLFIAYGSGVAAGAKLTGASVLDIAPTLLYLMGLPLGMDMDGDVLTEALEPDLVRTQPVTHISSYHDFLVEARPPSGDDDDDAVLDRLPGLLDARE